MRQVWAKSRVSVCYGVEVALICADIAQTTYVTCGILMESGLARFVVVVGCAQVCSGVAMWSFSSQYRGIWVGSCCGVTDPRSMVITIAYNNVWITPVEDITELLQPMLASLATTVSRMVPGQRPVCKQSVCSQTTPNKWEIHLPEWLQKHDPPLTTSFENSNKWER